MHTIKVADIPFGRFRDKGLPIDNISNYSSNNEEIVNIASQSELNLYRLLFVTKQGMCKIVSGGEFDVTKRTVASTKLNEEDELVDVEVVSEHQHVILQSKSGYFLRFDAEEISELKKTAVGVRGMKLDKSDELKDVYIFTEGENETVEVKGKELSLNRLKIGNRDTKGTKH